MNSVWLRPLTPPSRRALCSSGSLAVGHQASAIRHLSVTDGLQRLSTICTALHFCTRTFHWGSTATAFISSCCRKVSVCDITCGAEGSESGGRLNVLQQGEGAGPAAIVWMFSALIGTHWFDVFNSDRQSLQDLLPLSVALGVGKRLRAEAARKPDFDLIVQNVEPPFWFDLFVYFN